MTILVETGDEAIFERKPCPQYAFRLIPIQDLAHIRTRVLRRWHYVDDMARIMRGWPVDLGSVADLRSLVLPPIRLSVRKAALALDNGNHRLAAARLAGIARIWAYAPRTSP